MVRCSVPFRSRRKRKGKSKPDGNAVELSNRPVTKFQKDRPDAAPAPTAPAALAAPAASTTTAAPAPAVQEPAAGAPVIARSTAQNKTTEPSAINNIRTAQPKTQKEETTISESVHTSQEPRPPPEVHSSSQFVHSTEPCRPKASSYSPTSSSSYIHSSSPYRTSSYSPTSYGSSSYSSKAPVPSSYSRGSFYSESPSARSAEIEALRGSTSPMLELWVPAALSNMDYRTHISPSGIGYGNNSYRSNTYGNNTYTNYEESVLPYY